MTVSLPLLLFLLLQIGVAGRASIAGQVVRAGGEIEHAILSEIVGLRVADDVE
jgi:hypothetical protein